MTFTFRVNKDIEILMPNIGLCGISIVSIWKTGIDALLHAKVISVVVSTIKALPDILQKMRNEGPQKRAGVGLVLVT